MRPTIRTLATVTPFLALAFAVVAQEPSGTEGRKFALLVGVKNYQGTELGDLKFPEKDVFDLAEVLRSQNYRRVVLMTQSEAHGKSDNRISPRARPIRAQLKSILEDAKAGDTVVIGFSGHGAQIKGQAGLYFCPEEADLTDPKSLISFDEVQAAMKGCKATVKLLIADACRNEVTAAKSAVVEGLVSATRPVLPKPPEGVVALFSCSIGQKSFESPKLQRGFLFHHVIEGLKGKAATADGEVTLSRLVSYAVDEIPHAVKDEFFTESQRPEMLGSIAGKVVLVNSARRQLAKNAAQDTSDNIASKSGKLMAKDPALLGAEGLRAYNAVMMAVIGKARARNRTNSAGNIAVWIANDFVTKQNLDDFITALGSINGSIRSYTLTGFEPNHIQTIKSLLHGTETVFHPSIKEVFDDKSVDTLVVFGLYDVDISSKDAKSQEAKTVGVLNWRTKPVCDLVKDAVRYKKNCYVVANDDQLAMWPVDDVRFRAELRAYLDASAKRNGPSVIWTGELISDNWIRFQLECERRRLGVAFHPADAHLSIQRLVAK